VTVDGDFVYWASHGNGLVNKVRKAGGSVVTLAAGQGGPLDIAVSGGFVYWTNYSSNTVARTPK
jgi:DNA-binding beta-propeller fold protein YncE